jgi:hypothetical protein
MREAVMPIRKISTLTLAACLVTLLVGLNTNAAAVEKIQPWMLAEWSNPAPHFSDLGLTAKELAPLIGKRLVLLPHAERNIAIPGAHGLRRFANARFVTAVARVDLPAATLAKRMQDFSGYKHLFPMLTESNVQEFAGKNLVARYRMEIPLPAMATITVDFRIKQALEEDGSISALLIDGKAESLIAMLGGVTDELADQPVVSRWEFLPVNANQSLVVFTYWDRLDLKSYFARKFIEMYPELKVVGPYMVAAGAAEAIHRNFISPVPVSAETAPLGVEQLAKMQELMSRFSVAGPVAIMEPELFPVAVMKVPPLRYVSLATQVNATPALSRAWATSYGRLPSALRELKSITVNDRGQNLDLKLGIKFAFLVVRFSLGLDMLNTWATPDRLEFRRTAGNLAQLQGASEWRALNGGKDTLMVISAAHELGDDAPFVLRMAHKVVETIPYIDALASLAVQMVVMERLKPWIEKNAQSGMPTPLH